MAANTMANQWVHFSRRLPSVLDADAAGFVEALECDGRTRAALWNWIPPNLTDPAKLWEANGFLSWRPRK
jgi:hypothetical protein